MKRGTTSSIFVTFILLALLLSACSSGVSANPTSSAPGSPRETPITDEPAPAIEKTTLTADGPADQKDDSLGDKLVVGASADYYPFEYYTPDFQIDGFDISLIREIGERLGMEVEIKDYAFDGLGGALELDQIDVAISAISVTSERAAQVDFTDIYFVGEDGVLASDASDIEKIPTVDALGSYRVGIQSGTVYEDLLENKLVETGILPEDQFFVYRSADEAVRNLIDDQIDLVVLDYQPAKAIADSGAGKLVLKNRRGKVLLTFGPGQAVPLEGTEWVLATYADADGALVSATPGAEATAVFANGGLTGNAGCNEYNASYALDGESLTVSQAVTTRKFCEQPEGVMEQETALMSAYDAVSQYRLRQRTLELLDADDAVLMALFAKPDVTEMTSVTWVLESHGPIAKQQPVLENVDVTLQVDEKGQISGSAGCNTYNTTLEQTDDGISVGPAAVTQKMCPEEAVTVQESTYLAALQSTTNAIVRGERLLVAYGDGTGVLTFAPQKTDPLSGTAWLLETTGQDATPVLPDANISLIFGYNGDVHGYAGCNNFFSSYKAGEEKLRFGKLGSTKMLCPSDEENEQEKDYLAALKATRTYETEGVRLVGKGLQKQMYAIAVKQGNTELRTALNQALAEMVAEGRIAELIEQYLHIEAPIPPPIPPQPSCIDGMAWVADLNYNDSNMTNPPLLNPGEAFSKGWRIQNTGTCNWDSTYLLIPDGGNVPDARMGGQPTPIQGTVAPGETYDMKVDLVAPTKPGAYQGFWKMQNGAGTTFGQRIYVGIRVPLAPTPTPAPTQTPSPEIQFNADHTQLKQGECTTIWWDVQNVNAVYFYENGQDWRKYDVSGTGNRTVCPAATTTYNLRVEKPDSSVETRSITIYVEPAPDAPTIVQFFVQPQAIAIGECVTIKWDVRGDVNRVRLSANNDILWDHAPVRGNIQNCPPGPQTVTYIVEAWGPGGTFRAVQTIDVKKPAPNTPTPTAVPPTATPEPPTPEPDTPTPEPLPTDTPEPPTPEPPTPEPDTPTPEPPPGQDLLGSWLLDSMFKGRTAPQPVLPGTEIIVVFNPDGTLSGSGGCNSYNGTYTVGPDNSLSISPLALTGIACADPEGIMEQEQAYLAVLQAAAGYQVYGGQLQIFTNGGKDGLNYLAQ